MHFHDEPYYYHSKLLEVCLESIKGFEGNEINKQKLSKLFSLPFILSLICHESKPCFNLPYVFENQNFLGHRPAIDDPACGYFVVKRSAIDYLSIMFVKPLASSRDNLFQHKDKILQFLSLELTFMQKSCDFSAYNTLLLGYVFESLIPFLCNYVKFMLP